MRITKVELQNWGPFWGKVEFDMGSREQNQKPLTVIHAKNGHGKTSILRALKWVIAGGQNGKIKIGPNINWKALNGTEKFETSVTLHFRQGEEQYELRRFLNYNPTSIDSMEPRELKVFTENMPDKSRLSLQSGNKVPFSDKAAEETLERIFPPRLANFYFFDAADLLVQYDQVEMGKNSKAASLLGDVESALGFSGLDNMVGGVSGMLEEAQQELEKEGKNTHKANALIDEIEDVKKSINSLKVDKENLTNEIESTKEQIANLEAQMEGNEKNKELQLEQKRLRGDVSDRRAFVYSTLSSISAKFEELWMVPMRGRLKLVDEQVGQDRAKKDEYLSAKREIDLNIANLEAQLKSKKCNACGVSLQEKALEKNKTDLEKAKIDLSKLQEEFASFESKEVSSVEATLAEIWGADKEYELTQVLELDNKVSSARTELTNARQELNLLEAKLEAIHDVDYISVFQQIKDLAASVADGENDLKAIEENMHSLENDLQSKRNKLAKLNPKAKLAAKRANNLQLLLSSLRKVQSELKAEVKQQIETKANEVLEELKTPLDGAFALHVDENYDLDTDRPQPSAGFKQTLFLSFLFAIPLVAKAPFPLVMDSPLQHIDADHYEEFVEYCKTGVEQLVLLPHDKEITEGDVKKVFGEHLSDLYVISHNPSDGTSLIEQRS